jgi:hypothetical protein
MKNLFFAMLLSIVFVLGYNNANAQCAMCKASAETSIESGSTAAAGINKGVLYLFLTPYIVGGTIAFFWWRANSKAKS